MDDQLRKEASAELDDISAAFDKHGTIPEKNQMVDQFFYKYAYPRLAGILENGLTEEDNDIFKAKYIKTFGAHAGVKLFDADGKEVGTVPPLLSDGQMSVDMNVYAQSNAYVNENKRYAGKGDATISPALDNINITVDKTKTDERWAEIHQTYLELSNTGSMKTNEAVSLSLDACMEWK